MTDLLSQDEIDALLHGVDDVDDIDEPLDNDTEGAVSSISRLKTGLSAVECQRSN